MFVVVAAVVLAAAVALGALATRSPASQHLASYQVGRATLTINGFNPNPLSLIEQGSTLVSPGGAGLTWTSPEGWFLSLNGPFSFTRLAPAAAGSVGLDAKGTLQIDVGDHHRWAGFDSRTCAIVYTEVGLTRIAGSIRCRGLVWYDKASIELVRPIDSPPFDIDIDFEATGNGTLPVASPS